MQFVVYCVIFCSNRKMWSKFCKVFSILNLLYLVGQHVFADGINCGVLLDGSDKWEAAYEQCIQTNNVEDERGFENFSLNITLEEFNTFDDNCFIQCVYTKVEILNPEGLVDKNKTATIFKGNMTTEMMDQVTLIWDTCIDDAENVAKPKDGNLCKTLSLHDFCFSKMVDEAGILEMEC